MLNREQIADLKVRLTALCNSAKNYFDTAQALKDQDLDLESDFSDSWHNHLNAQLRAPAENLRGIAISLSVDIAGAARGSPLIAEADLHDLRHSTRRVLASIRFRRYRYWGVYVHHDEDIVLGVDPPSQAESLVNSVAIARDLFNDAASSIGELINFLAPTDTIAAPETGTATYRPNTAFVMMAIDKNQPDLEDIKNGIKDVCKEFGIIAITAEDIEHEGVITDRIVQEIETNEFLVADLTGERPNVYYEVGYAHAHGKRVILYRKAGTRLHFDVAHRNCPEYGNVTELKQQLRKRLEALTNKPRKNEFG